MTAGVLSQVLRVAFLGAAFVMLESAQAGADSIVDTGAPAAFGSGNTPFLYRGQGLAAEFVTIQSTAVTSIDVWLGCPFRSDCRAGDLSFRLYTNGGDVPGTSLFSQTTFFSPPIPPSQSNPFVTGSENMGSWQGISGLNWMINPGTYWVAFVVPSDSPFFWVTGGSINSLPNEAFGNPATFGWSPEDDLHLGVRISATSSAPPVPEPASLAFLSTGIAAVIVRTWRRGCRR
jgi:hypothetical protein